MKIGTRDPFPFVKAAGVTTQLDQGAAGSIKPTTQPPRTPDDISRYRNSYKQAAGMTITHYGKVNDVMPPEHHSYGKQTLGSEHVHNVLTHPNNNGVQAYVNELKEAQYARTKKEPLGGSVSRNYKFPEQTKKSDFQFGVPTVGSESAKDVMYRGPGLVEEELTKEMYKRSHNMYDAGEQKKRNYDWTSVDPNNHRFGKADKLVTNEARFCLHPEAYNESHNFPKTTVVVKNVEDFKDFSHDHLGKVKNLGQVTSNIDATSHVYGWRPRDKEPWDASKCIYGEPTQKAVIDDPNLGKSNRYGYRNMPKVGDETRVFGLPTIRSDVQKPKMRSIADQFNYGDESQAVELLFPQRFADLGLTRDDFFMPRPKEEIRTIFTRIGIEYKQGKFEGIYQRAQEIDQSNDKVSVKAFYQAVKEMDHL
jgi:hypothetical protein